MNGNTDKWQWQECTADVECSYLSGYRFPMLWLLRRLLMQLEFSQLLVLGSIALTARVLHGSKRYHSSCDFEEYGPQPRRRNWLHVVVDLFGIPACPPWRCSRADLHSRLQRHRTPSQALTRPGLFCLSMCRMWMQLNISAGFRWHLLFPNESFLMGCLWQ